MSEALRVIPPRVALVDPRTGLISREWFLFFTAVFNRSGGSSGGMEDDFSLSQSPGDGVEEIRAATFRMGDDFAVNPPLAFMPAQAVDNDRIAALESRVAELSKEVEALRLGPANP